MTSISNLIDSHLLRAEKTMQKLEKILEIGTFYITLNNDSN